MEWPRLYVMGPSDSGKSCLVKALLGEDYREVSSPSFSSSSSSSLSSLYSSSSSHLSAQINVHRWRNMAVDEPISPDGVEVWDVPGSQTHRDAHLLYVSSPCVVLLVVSADHQLDELLSIFVGVVNKCPACPVQVVITSRGQLPGEVSKKAENLHSGVRNWLTQRKLALKQHIEEIRATVTSVSATQATPRRKDQPEDQTLISALADRREEALSSKLPVSEDVLIVNTDTKDGVPQLRQALLKSLRGLASKEEPVRLPISLSTHFLSGLILEMADSGVVLLPWQEFSEILTHKLSTQCPKQWKESYLDNVLQFLLSKGHILKFRPLEKVYDVILDVENNNGRKSSSQTRKNSMSKQDQATVDKTINQNGSHDHAQSFVCVDPESFANMISACIIEDNKKTFRLEAGRFWPPESGFQPPDPNSLARVLEDIPSHGVLREAILPLLWQDFDLSEAQIKYCVALFRQLGVFIDHTAAHSDIAGLAMPDYLGLSAVLCYRFALMDMLPNSKPQLNWTTRPYRGDLQVCWRLHVLTSPPASVLRRALGVLQWAARGQCHYSHLWRDGLLTKFDEVTMCTELSLTGLDITSRVNGEEPGLEDEAVKKLWAHLVPVVMVLEHFLHQELPGVICSTKISLHGDVFFNMAATNQDVELSLERCLLVWQTSGHLTVPYRDETRAVDLEVLFPYKGDETKAVWTPNDFKSLVMKRRSVILDGQLSPGPHKPTDSPTDRRVTLTRNKSRRQTPKKKVISVTWRTNIAEDLEKETTTADTDPPAVSKSSSLSESKDIVSTTDSPASLTLTTTTSKGDEVAAVVTPASQPGLSLEDIMGERKELAARFVSAMMAAGVAKYISSCCSKDADGGAGVLTAAQICAAEATAQAAMAVHTGHLDGAASAVIDALRAAQSPNSGTKSQGSRSSEEKSSKTCAVF